MSSRSQRAALEGAGVERSTGDWDTIMRAHRKDAPTVVAVRKLHLIADPKRRHRAGGMRGSLIERLANCRQRGGIVWELDTGRRSDSDADYHAMLADALDHLAGTRARSRNIGRPKLQLSEREETIIRKHWFDLRHATNADALAAMAAEGVRLSEHAVYRRVGKSGRAPGITSKR